MDNTQLLQKVAEALKQQGLTVATAESCTGGLLAHTLTNISGSSEYFKLGIISYSNQSKTDLLGVQEQLLIDHGAVSEQTAKAMAIGVKNRSNVDIGVSTTGIAGPTGGTKDKPIGLVYIAIATPTTIDVKQYQFSGSRVEHKKQTVTAALELILLNLIK
jgi:PncC family amidohydrolase